MNPSTPTILGIDPGARRIGVAVLKGGELVFYAVRTIKTKSENETLVKLKNILAELINEYNAEFIVLEKIVFIQQEQSFVKTVTEEIRRFSKEKNITLFEYNPKLIRQIVCGTHKPTKRNTALLLAQAYPELARYVSVTRLWQKKYFAQLFDAIAAGLACARELRETESFSTYSRDKRREKQTPKDD